MIIWLNGAFGSGKTSTALELNRINPNLCIFDPEDVGLFIRDKVPHGDKNSDFQDHKLWRVINYEIIKHLAQCQEDAIIVPMTLVNKEYYNEIIDKLKTSGESVHVFSLMASKEVIHKRLLQRGDAPDSWGFHQTDRCIEFLERDKDSIKINTEKFSTREVANIIQQTIF